jgi:uncharacterized delta-60 repeat protein
MKKVLKITGALLWVAMLSMTNARGQQAGDIDSTWADSGWLLGGHVLNMGEEFTKIHKISNDRFMLIGQTRSDQVHMDMLLVMYNADGTLYTDFANQGVLTFDISLGGNDAAFDFVELWDGKFLIIGAAEKAQSVEMVLIRTLQDGTIDNSFGTNGIARYDAGPGTLSVPNSIAVSSGNNIFVGAQILDGTTFNFSVFKFTQGGGTDITYGDNGISTIAIGSANCFFKAMHVTADEEIIFIGNLEFAHSQNAFMSKLDASGALDADWADGGTFMYSPATMNYFNDLYVDETGSFYIAGHHGIDYNINGFIRKFESSGLPDVSFATNGKITMDIGSTNGVYYTNIKRKADGNYLVTGKAFGQSLNKIHAFTFDANGAGDCEFSCAGVYHDLPMEVTKMSQDLLEIMDDGSILTGGIIRSPEFTGQKAYLAKLLIENQTVSVFHHEIEKLQLTVYPNPTTSEFYIKNSENLEILRVSLFSLEGRMVQHWTGSLNSYPINSALPNGNYIAKIVTNQGVSSQMITIGK